MKKKILVIVSVLVMVGVSQGSANYPDYSKPRQTYSKEIREGIQKLRRTKKEYNNRISNIVKTGRQQGKSEDEISKEIMEAGRDISNKAEKKSRPFATTASGPIMGPVEATYEMYKDNPNKIDLNIGYTTKEMLMYAWPFILIAIVIVCLIVFYEIRQKKNRQKENSSKEALLKEVRRLRQQNSGQNHKKQQTSREEEFLENPIIIE